MNQGDKSARREPRFVHETIVEVQLHDREELWTLWTKDISNGGLFVITDRPPRVGTRVNVGLQIPDAGKLLLGAVVAHVVDVRRAGELGCKPGAGLRLIDLGPEERRWLLAYVHGLAERFTVETDDLLAAAGSDDAGDAPREVAWVLEEARRIVRNIAQEDLYAAIGLDAAASPETIDQNIRATIERLAGAATKTSGQQYSRIEAARAELEKVRRLFIDPERRLDYDFRHGHFRVEERLEEAKRGGTSAQRLREHWGRVFPAKVEEAAEHAMAAQRFAALGDQTLAIRAALAALDLDPFNDTLRSAILEGIVSDV